MWICFLLNLYFFVFSEFLHTKYEEIFYQKKVYKFTKRQVISLCNTIEQAAEARKLAEKELLEPYINDEQPPTND